MARRKLRSESSISWPSSRHAPQKGRSSSAPRPFQDSKRDRRASRLTTPASRSITCYMAQLPAEPAVDGRAGTRCDKSVPAVMHCGTAGEAHPHGAWLWTAVARRRPIHALAMAMRSLRPGLRQEPCRPRKARRIRLAVAPRHRSRTGRSAPVGQGQLPKRTGATAAGGDALRSE